MSSILLRKFKTIMERERRLGFTNASVFGGLAALVERESRLNLARQPAGTVRLLWERMLRLSREYLRRPPSGRAELLKEMEAALQELALLQPAPAPPSPAAALPPANASPPATGQPRRSPAAGGQRRPGRDHLLPASLSSPVLYLKGVGPQRARLLERLGISTIQDLLFYLPREYEDRSSFPPLAEVVPRPGVQTVRGRIIDIRQSSPRPGLKVTRALLSDSSGTVTAVWFNQPHVLQQLRREEEVVVTGQVVDNFPYGIEIRVRELEKPGESLSPHSQRLVPIYPTTAGMPVKTLRQLVHSALEAYGDKAVDLLPEEVRRRHGLLPLSQALWNVHFPGEPADAEKSRRRLAFDELFFFQLGLALLRQGRTRTAGVAHRGEPRAMQRFLDSLPFPLTPAQKRVIREITADMSRPVPMNRLLQGDVGSGKTVVAAASLVQCAASGYQGAVMVPTEILAEQHHRTINRLLAPLSLEVALLRGNQPRRVREQIRRGLEDGTIPLVVGTQALLQEGVNFKALGLVIIDEQHRFGVSQRAQLQQKGSAPDLLVMTATPIPRTLAMTLYGDLDLSVIDELPPGRLPVHTRCYFQPSPEELYRLVAGELRAGRQAYFVCPLVEESEALDLEAATRLAAELQHKVFPQFRVGMLHGRMRAEEKEALMRRFQKGELDILVSTTVVEVGVDVPNASVMVVEDAGRFGLAQLHQLRGRIGRGSHQGYCLLVARQPSPEVRRRLAVLESTSNGFQVAEEDLKLRGPGEHLGLKQHGAIKWKIADLSRDMKILEQARQEAWRLVDRDPRFDQPAYQQMYAAARSWFNRLDFPVKL